VSFLIIVGTLVAWFAAIGRQAMPSAERISLREWKTRDLIANFIQGLNLTTPRNPALEHYTRHR
jgi:hypothetical protein